MHKITSVTNGSNRINILDAKHEQPKSISKPVSQFLLVSLHLPTLSLMNRCSRPSFSSCIFTTYSATSSSGLFSFLRNEVRVPLIWKSEEKSSNLAMEGKQLRLRCHLQSKLAAEKTLRLIIEDLSMGYLSHSHCVFNNVYTHITDYSFRRNAVSAAAEKDCCRKLLTQKSIEQRRH